MATDTRARTGTGADQEKIAAVRAELPIIDKVAYLNTGTNGPVPQRSYDTLVAQATAELTEGRIGMAGYQQFFATMNAARAAFAGILGCGADEIALTHNTTEGLNIALMGIEWSAGDEIITATTEHPGGLYPAYLIKQRHGARIRMTEIGLVGLDPVEELRKVLTPRTKAVVLSHVSWASGMVLPMREISDLAHSVGALVICDAAQACGMVPSKVYDMGVDAYACSGQKWLCGPDGTGALFVRKDRLPDIWQTYMGYAGVQMGMSNREGYYVPPPAASRYEAATLHRPSMGALVKTLDWIANEVGWDWAYRRIADLGRYTYDTLAAIPGVTMYSPNDVRAGLTHFTVEGITPPDLTAKLAEQGILIRYTPYPSANRVSTSFYNTEDEVDRLAEAIEAVRAAA
jgi:L-cysteine/cystine lyase